MKVWAVGLFVSALALPSLVEGQARDLYADIATPELEFSPPVPERHVLSNGVEVFFLADHTLPLVSVFARFSGGPANLGRARLGAATAVPQLLRSGGTSEIPPDSVDRAMEFYAAETSFGGGGGSVFASLNSLTRHFEPVLDLWFDLLRDPGFAADRVEVWRGQELDAARRRRDHPGSLAISEFNRLMYGDHPTGWRMEASDLELEDLSLEVLREVHRKIYCPANMILGVSGDASWGTMEPLLERAMDRWAACPSELPDAPLAEFSTPPGVYLLRKDLPQSTVILGKSSNVRLGDGEDYFSSRIGNTILGAGGLTSRLVSEVRTELGYAYSASSVWTTPTRSQGILGAITQTKAESTVPAIRAIIGIMEEMSDRPPQSFEVEDAIGRTRNSFVFNFQDGAQIVSRQMAYLSQDLPLDWLTRYLSGIGDVTPESVRRVIQENMDSTKLIILIVGNPDRFGEAIETLGPVTELPLPNGG